MKIVQNSQLREYVEKKVREDWSPEQIAGRLKVLIPISPLPARE